MHGLLFHVKYPTSWKVTIPDSHQIGTTSSSFLGWRPSLLIRSKDATNGAPGLTTRNKKLLGAPGIATNGAIGRYEVGGHLITMLQNLRISLRTGLLESSLLSLPRCTRCEGDQVAANS